MVHPAALETRISVVGRTVLAIVGVFALAVPAWELRQPLLHPGWHTLPIAVILCGAAVVGVLFLAAAIAGDEMIWLIEDGVLTLTRRSLIRRRSDRYTAADITRITARRESWDSRPDTWRVVLALRAGSSLETLDQPTLDAAEALRRRIPVALGEGNV